MSESAEDERQDFEYDEGDALRDPTSSAQGDNFKVVIRVRPPVDREVHGYRQADIPRGFSWCRC